MPGELIMGLAGAQIPLGIIPCNMMGATGPMPLIGAVAQQNAEVVAGLVATQMVCPGLPVIMAPRVTFMDMKTGAGLWAAPEFGLAVACSATLAYFYNLPVSVSGFTTSAKLPDQQSGFERCFNSLCVTLAGCDIAGAAGSLDNVLISSPTQLVIDSEIAGLSRQIKYDFEVDPAALADEVIDAVRRGTPAYDKGNQIGKDLQGSRLQMPPLDDQFNDTTQLKSAEWLDQRADIKAAETIEKWSPFLGPAMETEIDRIVIAAAKRNL